MSQIISNEVTLIDDFGHKFIWSCLVSLFALLQAALLHSCHVAAPPFVLRGSLGCPVHLGAAGTRTKLVS